MLLTCSARFAHWQDAERPEACQRACYGRSSAALLRGVAAECLAWSAAWSAAADESGADVFARAGLLPDRGHDASEHAADVDFAGDATDAPTTERFAEQLSLKRVGLRTCSADALLFAALKVYIFAFEAYLVDVMTQCSTLRRLCSPVSVS